MSKRKSKQLFLLLSLSAIYIVVWIFLLILLYPWAVYVFTHLFELEFGHLLFFSLHFFPFTIIGGFVFMVAFCYFLACIGKVVGLLKTKKAENVE